MRSSSRRASSLLVVKSRTCLRQPPAAPRRLPKPPRRPQRKGEAGDGIPPSPGAGSPALGRLKCMVCFIFCFSFIKKIRGIKLSSFVKVLRGERFGLSADIGRSQSRPRRLWRRIRFSPAPTFYQPAGTFPPLPGESRPCRTRSRPLRRRCSEARNPRGLSLAGNAVVPRPRRHR